jgi:hypothetical protein
MEFSIQYLVQIRYWGLKLIWNSLFMLLKFIYPQVKPLVIFCIPLRGTHFPVLFIVYSAVTVNNLFSSFRRSKLEVRLICAGSHGFNSIIVICDIFSEASNHSPKFYGYYQFHSAWLFKDCGGNFMSFFHPGRCPALLGYLHFDPALSLATWSKERSLLQVEELL